MLISRDRAGLEPDHDGLIALNRYPLETTVTHLF
jgi:hypothetical protein